MKIFGNSSNLTLPSYVEWLILGVGLGLAILCAQVGAAQTAPAQVTPAQVTPSQPTNGNEQTGELQLVDGLLELLDSAPGDPSMNAKRSEAKPSLDSLDSSGNPRKHSGAADNSSGVPSGEQTTHLPLQHADPFIQIQHGMIDATNSLRRGDALDETIQTQQKIVEDLDALIRALDSEQRGSMQEEQQTEEQLQQQYRRQQNESEPEPDSSRDGAEEPVPSESNTDANATPQPNDATQPGETGQRAESSTVRRNDPVALQQDVWGHLPERIRSRMQSRMVEQFLPDYREPLEAYYRALLGQEKPE